MQLTGKTVSGIGTLQLVLFASLAVSMPVHGQALSLDDILEHAKSEQSAGQYPSAAADYAHATTLNPNIPELWANRGVMEYLAGDAQSSITSLKHALVLNPKLFTPIFFLGKAYVQAGKPELALRYLDQAHSLRPGDIEVLLSLGKTDEVLHQLDHAASAYRQAARLDPKNAAAWFGLGVASLARIEADGRDLAASAAKSVWARSLYADELFAQGRPAEALDVYQVAISSATSREIATLTRNEEQMQSRPDLYPFPSNSQESLPRLNLKLKALQGIVSLPTCPSAETAHRLSSGRNETTLLQDAACAYWTEDYERSAADASRVPLGSPQRAESLYWSVKANERIAVAALSLFEQLAPQAAPTYDLVGDLYRHRRQPDNAMSEYQKARTIDAHDPVALLGMAAIYLSNGNPNQAASMTQFALADRPLDPQLNLLMAEALIAQHRLTSAKPFLEKCLTAPSEFLPRVHALLGRVYGDEGKTQEAIHQLEQGLSSDEDGSVHYQLSRLYRKTGNLVDAQKAEAGAKALEHQRLKNAVIAVRETTGSNH